MISEPSRVGDREPQALQLVVQTDKNRPRAWMLLVFTAGVIGVATGLSSLKNFSPPDNPLLDAFFLGEGRHYWIIQDPNASSCSGAITGGWKKRSRTGESLRFRFSMRKQESESLYNGELYQGELKALFGEYKNLDRLNIRAGGRDIRFNGRDWKGLANPPKELILLVEGSDETRIPRLPARQARAVEEFLASFISGRDALRQVTPSQYHQCQRSLKKESSRL